MSGAHTIHKTSDPLDSIADGSPLSGVVSIVMTTIRGAYLTSISLVLPSTGASVGARIGSTYAKPKARDSPLGTTTTIVPRMTNPRSVGIVNALTPGEDSTPDNVLANGTPYDGSLNHKASATASATVATSKAPPDSHTKIKLGPSSCVAGDNDAPAILSVKD